MQVIDNFNFEGKKAIVRVDFNVPLNDSFEITDDTRIQAALPTIKKIIGDGGSAVLMSHLGRPKSGPEEKFSLKHLIPRLKELTGTNILFAEDCIGDKTVEMKQNLKPGEILLLENLRFHKGETSKDAEECKAFAQELAKGVDVYVNDAFGTAHRAHASTAVIAQFFDDKKMFGHLINSELKSLEKVLKDVKRPFTAILGGAKVSTKITIIENMLDKVNNLIIGGGMTYTFVKAQGGNIGKSICEDDLLDTAKNLIQKAEEKGVKLHIATDALAADDFSEDANTKVVKVDEIDADWQGLDIGPETIESFSKVIEESATILWNGPAGVFEMEKFAGGTKALANAIIKATEKGAFSLIGGGDSVAAINKYKIKDKFSYVSTAGGALLESLEGKDLPGIKAVKE